MTLYYVVWVLRQTIKWRNKFIYLEKKWVIFNKITETWQKDCALRKTQGCSYCDVAMAITLAPASFCFEPNITTYFVTLYCFLIEWMMFVKNVVFARKRPGSLTLAIFNILVRITVSFFIRDISCTLRFGYNAPIHVFTEKLLMSSFHLKDHSPWFRSQTQKLELPCTA